MVRALGSIFALIRDPLHLLFKIILLAFDGLNGRLLGRALATHAVRELVVCV
jgi:hypothetical protein